MRVLIGFATSLSLTSMLMPIPGNAATEGELGAVAQAENRRESPASDTRTPWVASGAPARVVGNVDVDVRTIRVLSYNIHIGRGLDDRFDLGRIADVINESGADLVSLQEVDQNASRSGNVDQPAVLASLTGMSVVFGKNRNHEGGGGYGNAVLSRFPMECYRNNWLPRENPEDEPRGVLEVQLRVDSQPLVFLATHLHHRRSEPRDRLDSIAIFFCALDRLKEPALVAGDLNAFPEKEEMSRFFSFMGDSYESNEGGEYTAPADDPDVRIDYILHDDHPRLSYRPGSYLIINDARTQVASDHLPVYAEYDLEILPGRGSPWPCSSTVYVDGTRSVGGDGTPGRPYKQVAVAVGAAPEGSLIGIRGAIYDEPQSIAKGLCLCSYNGMVELR